jgi:hypothetical protein
VSVKGNAPSLVRGVLSPTQIGVLAATAKARAAHANRAAIPLPGGVHER